jgi:hypothetical protein
MVRLQRACLLERAVIMWSRREAVRALLTAVPLAPAWKRDGLQAQTRADGAWRSLFDGTSLGEWEETPFGGEGLVHVVDGTIVLEFGEPLTGITWRGALERTGYEVRLEARRMAGSDFFCGLTFPVAESACSLILGGWGGSLVGLSTLDGRDASGNETKQHISFDQSRWYRVRVRVAAGRIGAWLDERSIVDVATAGRRIGIRPEVELSQPLGIAAYRTRAAVRGIETRKADG